MLKSAIQKSVAIAAVVAASQASAQAPQDITFWQSEAWEVTHRATGPFCVLRRKIDDPAGLTFAKGAGEPGLLRYRSAIEPATIFSEYDVTFRFDDQEFAGILLTGGTFLPQIEDKRIEEAFQSAQTLSILKGDEMIAAISLAGSSAAFEQLEACAAQWPDGFVPTIPPPLPPMNRVMVPEPDLTTPQEPNLRPEPLSASNWITADEYPSGPLSRKEEGRLVMRLSINAQGRVSACEVTETSGYAELDERTCELLRQRARYQPGTDASGQRVDTTMTLGFTWNLPT